MNNTAISTKASSYNSYDSQLHNSVHSVKFRNNSKASGISCSVKRYSDMLPTLIQNKQISVVDKRSHRITSFRNSDHDQKSKRTAMKEPTKRKISVPSSVDDIRLETRVSTSQQEQQQQTERQLSNHLELDVSKQQRMLLQQYQEQQRQLQQQQLQQLLHHSLALSFSPRVQRRPVSFYLSRSLDKFIKHPIPEADEEEGQDDEEDEEEEEEEEDVKGEEGCKKEKKEHFDSHTKRIHEKIGTENLSESNMVLVESHS